MLAVGIYCFYRSYFDNLESKTQINILSRDLSINYNINYPLFPNKSISKYQNHISQTNSYFSNCSRCFLEYPCRKL